MWAPAVVPGADRRETAGDMRDPGTIEALRALPRAAEVFDALAATAQAHVVGGAVRDVLLGRRPSELDLVVVGDAIEVARALEERLGGRVRAHERFRTATLELGEAHFDLASARRERYPRPGALPEVELGATLAEDLARRDFTVNAIAVACADGTVTAHPGALEDLRARRLGVLHDASFRDDPTRLLRLARYAGRLGLDVAPATARLVEAALAADALATVSGQRVGRELRMAAAEPQPRTLRVLVATGIAGAVLEDVAWDEEILDRALALCPADGRRDLLALAAMALEQDSQALGARLRRLGFPREDAGRIKRVAGVAPRLAEGLGELGQGPPSRVWERLSREPAEAVALAGALAGASGAQVAQAHLDRLRHVRPAVSGTELEDAGLSGPQVGRGLAAARAAALADPDAGRAEQLAAALAAGREAGGRES